MPIPLLDRYRRPATDDPLDQGDIIGPCPLPQILDPASGWNDDELKALTYENASKELVIVVSQTCDLKRTGKEQLRRVMVCPVYTVDRLLNQDVFEEDMDSTGKPVTPRNLDRLKSGNLVGYHHLPEYEEPGAHLVESAVDLLQVYTVPRQLLEYLINTKGHRRLAVNPPYREALGHALGAVFSRVGLP